MFIAFVKWLQPKRPDMQLFEYILFSRYIIITLAVLFFSQNSTSQSFEVGLGVGTLIYYGDLSSSSVESFSSLRGGVQFFARKHITDPVHLRINALYGHISGDDAHSEDEWRRRRNLNFFSRISEFSGILEYSLFKSKDPLGDHLRIYAYGGVGVFHFNPRTVIDNITYDLQPLGTEGQGMPGFPDRYNLWTINFPLGGGISIKITENLYFNPELGIRFTLTDYLDDVSTDYVNYFELRAGNGDLAARLGNRTGEFLGQTEPVIVNTGTQRGNPRANDVYFAAMINLIYKFPGRSNNGYNVKCPTFK